jgi:uncharacterized protein (TIGR00375 family)
MATSGKLVPEYLEYWARLKGINVIGTGDCIHPGWQQELAEKLEPAENGLFKLKDKYRLEESKKLKHEFIPDEVYFILTGEISSIYKRDGKVRKVHNLAVFPDMESLLKVQRRLDEIGNIRSDGRPILGLDSRVILEMVLESSGKSFLIPAHIWTPWFSALGSKSGFDTIEECYGDLTEHIFAVETGLSSDPPMNWTCSFLDRFRLVSNSDAHSPEKLGREANLFDTELSCNGIYSALKYDRGFTGTIEFYPQEGKYHYDGHRKCGIMWNPLETAHHNGICPVCGKEVTRGVMYRVAELGDRNIIPEAGKKEFHSITQLPDLIAEIKKQKSSSSKSVAAEYLRLITSLGSEFHVYLNSGIDRIAEAGGELLAEGVRRLRNGEIHVEEGYDGEFGTVKVFREGEMDSFRYSPLFGNESSGEKSEVKHSVEFDIEEFKALIAAGNIKRSDEISSAEDEVIEADMEPAAETGLTAEQMEGVTHRGSPCVVIAGPGSGKTKILTERVKYLIEEGFALPEEIAALTFSNRAADEMRERIGTGVFQGGLTISTLHSFGLSIIKENLPLFKLREDFMILNDDEKTEIIKKINPEDKRNITALRKEISNYKQGMDSAAEYALLKKYRRLLDESNSIDIDDLILLPVEQLISDASLRKKYTGRLKHLLIDEFQDINAAQYMLIKAITQGGECGLFAIGDPDQSIYGFRGSDTRFITDLKNDYPDLKVITLTRSFRCPGIILKAAGSILDKSSFLHGLSDGVKITISESQSDSSEADWIASEIENLVGGVRSFSMESGISDGGCSVAGFRDFAVLCRASFMFDPIVKAFSNHGIPCQLIDTEPFYMKHPYKEAFDILKGAWHAVKHQQTGSDPRVEEMIKSGNSIRSIMLQILKEKKSVFDEERITGFFGDMNNYDDLFNLSSLRSGADDYIPDYEAVPVITIHAAKGLEFNTVFIPGCEEGVIPFSLFGNAESDIEEEKRIFYVGITRAKEKLFLSYTGRRLFRGRVLNSPRSSFLDKIEKDLVEKRKREPEKQKKDDNQLKLF